MNKKGLAVLLLIVLVSTLAFTGCTRKLMWVSTSRWDYIEATYKKFTGTEKKSIVVEEGDTLVIDYETEVKGGTLSMTITDPDGDEVTSLTTDTDGTEQIEIEKGGRHTLSIQGYKTEGSFRIEWSIE